MRWRPLRHKWERAILEALKEAQAYYLTDLLPIPHTRSQLVALNRAANKLQDAGKVDIAAAVVTTVTVLERSFGPAAHGPPANK